jgi:hypothetical protein
MSFPTINRFPLVYSDKEVRPEWLPRTVSLRRVKVGFGCDTKTGPDGNPIGGGGVCFGGDWRPGKWKKTRDGYWILPEGHCPQHICKASPHPRVMRWRNVVGVEAEHRWQVPVLITPRIDLDSITWSSALDRTFTPDGWTDPEDLASMVEDLMTAACAPTFQLVSDTDENERALAELAIKLLQVGHHIDPVLMEAMGWMSETMLGRILLAACDREVH